MNNYLRTSSGPATKKVASRSKVKPEAVAVSGHADSIVSTTPGKGKPIKEILFGDGKIGLLGSALFFDLACGAVELGDDVVDVELGAEGEIAVVAEG